MSVTTSGVYRVLRNPRNPDELLLLDTESADPTYVPIEGDDDPSSGRVTDLEPGNLIEGEIEWDAEGCPRLGAFEVLTRTHVEFLDGVTGLFETAREVAREAAMAGEGMNSRVTRNTDGEENGVCYTFSKQASSRDLYEEFREGITPLEPLVERIAKGGVDPPYDVFVIRPRDEPFLVVYIALVRDGLLARTVRETYSESVV